MVQDSGRGSQCIPGLCRLPWASGGVFHFLHDTLCRKHNISFIYLFKQHSGGLQGSYTKDGCGYCPCISEGCGVLLSQPPTRDLLGVHLPAAVSTREFQLRNATERKGCAGSGVRNERKRIQIPKRKKKAACEGTLSAALKQQSPAEAMELRQLIPAGDPSRSAWISFGCNGFWYRLYHSLRLPVPLISVFCFTNTSDLSGLCSPESQGDFSSWVKA